jgi:hypothetical protein
MLHYVVRKRVAVLVKMDAINLVFADDSIHPIGFDKLNVKFHEFPDWIRHRDDENLAVQNSGCDDDTKFFVEIDFARPFVPVALDSAVNVFIVALELKPGAAVALIWAAWYSL